MKLILQMMLSIKLLTSLILNVNLYTLTFQGCFFENFNLTRLGDYFTNFSFDFFWSPPTGLHFFAGAKNPGLTIFFENFSAWANILSLTKRYSVACGGVGDWGKVLQNYEVGEAKNLIDIIVKQLNSF